MKNVFSILFSLIICSLLGQEKLIDKNAIISFESLYLKSFQDVKAINENVTVVFNTKTGEIACLALIKGFRFEVALMEEHFNENYIDSSKFPKAIFKGIIDDFDLSKLSIDEKKYNLKGILDLHGVKNEMNIKISIKKDQSNQIILNCNFFVNNNNHNIIIPKIVKNKISDKISVTLKSTIK